MKNFKQFEGLINTVEDVKRFFAYLQNDLSLDFHPDTPFSEYINSATGEPTFTEMQQTLLQMEIDNCFIICLYNKIDIYQLSIIASTQSYPESLELLRSANCYISAVNGDTYKIVNGCIILDEPVNIQDIEVGDWFNALSQPDRTFVDTIIKRLFTLNK
jgi:hypothetical protein